MDPDEILNSPAKKICVIAAPGSGKTKRVLLPKVVQILEDASVDARDVLLLSFSRLSAKDLKERVSSMGDRAPRTSTVHALCLAFLLSENDHDIRNRVESILLDFEKDTLLCDLKLVFPTVHKNELKKTLKQFSAGWAIQPHDEVFEEDDFKRRFKAAVIRWLVEHEAAMMEEIVYSAVTLGRQLGTADFIRRPRYILVDEYQDLNRLEQDFVNILAEESDLLLVVGDPNQSIYGFKYSYPTGITELSGLPEVSSWRSLVTGRCPRRVVDIANQLILQADPSSTELLESLHDVDGEVRFVRKETQTEEFAYVARAISDKLRAGVTPEELLVLVPKKKLGKDFVEYVNLHKEELGIPEEQKVVFESKIELTDKEQERVLLFGLAVNPNSLLHARAYLGLGDEHAMAQEMREVKEHYGGLQTAIMQAESEDFPRRRTRIRSLCERMVGLRSIIAEAQNDRTVDAVLGTLFPETDEELTALRAVLHTLKEEEDSLGSLYSKFIEHLRAVPTDATTVRVMTIMGSKGLEAKNVYLLGCNAGNMPGSNHSEHMSDQEFLEEQRRFLFVAVTRASESLVISWARHIPFGQSRQHHTGGIGYRAGQTVVGVSPFLRDITGIEWET